MAKLTIESLAKIIGTEPNTLLSQMKDSGLGHTKLSDEVTDSDKKTLLEFLKNQQTTSKKTISLKKDASKVKSSSPGQVEIKRKKVIRGSEKDIPEDLNKSSSSIDFEEIEKKRIAGEEQKRVDASKRKKDIEQKTLVTRRKVRTKETPENLESQDHQKSCLTPENEG